MRTWTTMLLVLTALAAHASPSRAEGLGRDVRQRCLQAVVRVEVDTPRGTVSGSGTLINSRGFILTNFHVVGHTSHRTGFPGTRHGSEFRIALTRDEREPVVDEFVAEVVRGNVELDLALLRIVRATAEGAALPESFPVLEMAPDVAALGTGVWALGFPDGLRTINLTAGQVAGFEKNDADEVAWLRTDTEFNPGNSGGALIDDRCRLVGIPTAISNSVEPIEFVRPATRVPAEWLAALESPEVVPQPTEGSSGSGSPGSTVRNNASADLTTEE
jgi:S1-C subfamily serine protease